MTPGRASASRNQDRDHSTARAISEAERLERELRSIADALDAFTANLVDLAGGADDS